MNRYFYSFLCVFLTHFFIHSFELEAQQIAVQRDTSYNQVTKVLVDGDFCALNIKGYDGDSVEFTGVIKSDENQKAYELNTKVVDGVLSIKVLKPEKWKSHWGEIELRIPNNTDVELITLSGKVNVSDISGVKLSVESKSGHILLTSVQGVVSAISPAGDIIVDKFKGTLNGKSKTGKAILRNTEGENSISTSKGDIIAANCSGSLKVDGGTGSQELENIKGNIFIKSTSGGVKLSLSEGTIHCRTFAGELKLFQTDGTYTIQSSTGNITGTRVKFNSSSSFSTTEGNIKIQMNTKNDLAFELKSNNSFLRAMGKSKKKSLKIGKGKIVITGTSTTGSQAYY